MSFDIDRFRPFIDIALGAARQVGGNSPAMTTVLNGLSSFVDGVPQLAAQKTQIDKTLADARRAAGNEALDTLRKRP